MTQMIATQMTRMTMKESLKGIMENKKYSKPTKSMTNLLYVSKTLASELRNKRNLNYSNHLESYRLRKE
jgi:hypothetical protein